MNKTDFTKAEQIMYNIVVNQIEEILIKEMENVRKEALRYYTPAIEDIRIGYECEFQIDKKNNQWRTFVFKKSDLFECPICNGEKVNEKDCELRTPYLTKEQIEDEGWTLDEAHMAILDFSKEGNDEFIWKFNKDHVSMWFWQNLHEIRLRRMDFSRETTRDYGFKDDFHVTFKCPSINEFRYICKLLNINND